MLKSLFGKKEKKAMNERQQILEMLASGKITVAEAEKLLSVIEDTKAGGAEPMTAADDQRYLDKLHLVEKRKARFLRIAVSEDGGEKVDIRVPMQLIRAGVKLGSFIPKDLQGKIDDSLHEQGVQFSLADIKPEMVEELIDGLSDFSLDVNDDGDKVRIFCE